MPVDAPAPSDIYFRELDRQARLARFDMARLDALIEERNEPWPELEHSDSCLMCGAPVDHPLSQYCVVCRPIHTRQVRREACARWQALHPDYKNNWNRRKRAEGGA